MNPSRPFILRPVATSLLMVAIVLADMVAFRFLPLSALPQVDYPTIQVQTLYPGGSPEVMSNTVTAPLERQFGQMSGLDRMSSTSAAGVSIITLQFSLGQTLDVAEQEVQAAINAGGSLLPADLPAPPVYAKVNPADAPVLTMAITSDTLPLTEVQNLVNTQLAQKISQVSGVGLVSLSGGQRPAVRIQANTQALAANGIGLDTLRTAISAANSNGAKGSFDGPKRAYTINSNDQLLTVEDYKNLIVSYKNGAPIRMVDVAQVVNSAENTQLGAWAGTKTSQAGESDEGKLSPAIILNVQRQPGANVIATVNAIKVLLPELQAGFPAGLKIEVLVIFAFLGSLRATVIASIAVPISLIGTLGLMYLLGYSLNNLSLMALTIATGFVVDDAIVMIENIARYIEEGEKPLQAAFKGATQIGFTIISLTVSLIAVLIPLLFMGDVVGRLFREFAVTLAITILISAVVSLTLVPMMSARWLRHEPKKDPAGTGFGARAQRFFSGVMTRYDRSLHWVIDHQALTLLVALLTMVLTVVLYLTIPKGLFPTQDLTIDAETGPTEYRVSLEGVDSAAITEWMKKLVAKLQSSDKVRNVSSDAGAQGLAAFVNVNRDTAARLSITASTVDDALYSAFGQRIVSTIFTETNQYRVILEARPGMVNTLQTLGQLNLIAGSGTATPLSAIADITEQQAPLQITHVAQYPASTLNFDTAPGVSLGQSVDAIRAAAKEIGLPGSVTMTFLGASGAYERSLSNQLWLIWRLWSACTSCWACCTRAICIR